MSFIEQYLLQLNTEKRRWRRAVVILTGLSLIVALVTTWNLRMTGVTIANDATCKYVEHHHTSECPAKKVLICEIDSSEPPDEVTNTEATEGSAENTTQETPEETTVETSADTTEESIKETHEVSAEETPIETTEVPVEQSSKKSNSHTHTEECYEIEYLCEFEEHIHSIACYSDTSADVETAEIWEQTLPDDLGRYWSENLARIAVSQIGVRESEKNYIVAEDGETELGITRYGQWYGNPHGDWSAMFAAFCLHYADVPQDAIPYNPGVYNMMQLCEDKNILSQPDEYVGMNGNILFMDTDDNGNADKILIVTELEESATEEMTGDIINTVGGDWDNAVMEVKIAKDDPRILAYIPTATVREAYLQSLPLYSIDKNSNIYTIDVYALPVDYDRNRITDLPVTELGTLRVDNTTKRSVAEQFDYELGIYHNAYFGTETSVSVDNINTVWRYQWWYTYYLAYAQINGTQNQQWLNSSDTTISLYLRYTPEFTVTFESEGFDPLMEYVSYKEYPTLTEPSQWSREGYILVGWLANDDQTVYSYDEIMLMPVTSNKTYTAQWRQNVTISFDTGQYADQLYPVEAIQVTYGSRPTLLPTPNWKNNSVAMAFDGWYLNSELTQPVTPDTKFYEDTTLYAKWSPKDDGYYVYFMDFSREGQTPLVLVTYSVTENQTAFPYTPGNEPEGTQWDGKWYLDDACTTPYNFIVPVSQMEDYLTGANGRDLYLYPGTQPVCRAIFVTYGSKVDPVTVPSGEMIDLDQYRPTRQGYEFAGWTLIDGTPVSGMQTLNETTTYYATWNSGYVPFEAVLRIENANDFGMTQADILGTWYAKAGSQIRVKSTYSGSGNSRTGTHQVVCVVDGTEYPVYKNAALTQQATLNDVYSTYFVYNNTGTNWTDEVNWDDVYTGGEVPYSTRPISSIGDTIINFDYMRVRNDIVFTIPNTTNGGYIDVYKLQQNGLITGSVTYNGTKPTAIGQNVSATGVSAENISWSYTPATRVGTSYNNYYTLHNMKYGQRIYEVYPVGGSWLTARNAAYHQYAVGSGQYFSSRRQDLTSDFFSGSGRGLIPYSLTVEFENQEYIALMYAVECLVNETPDFVLNGVGYKVDTELCEVVKHTGFFAIKDLEGCEPGINSNGTYNNNNKYYTANTIPSGQQNYAIAMSSAYIGNTSVYTLFNETYWPYYARFNGVQNIKTFAKAYIFYFNRLHMNIQFNFGYDSNGDGTNETIKYENVAYGENISEYQFGMPGYSEHSLLNREGYEFAGWLDANGFVLEADDWESLTAKGDSENNTMIFIAKWEKISNNIVEYYEDRSSTEPFESHYFEDGEIVPYPTMSVYPQGWVWQEYGEGQFQRFDWDVPMYGEYGVQEVRTINGEERVVNVIRIYGTWDETHTKVVYDPNAPQGGIPGTAPTDTNEYTIWQSEVPVASRGETANTDPEMVFVGWLLDRNGIVYQPGDHIPVRWPRTMILTAQWAKTEDVVYLRYDPNGGKPQDIYPNDTGFTYKKNATASVWDNTGVDGSAWFSRIGYTFVGWNTEPDGSGTSYAPDTSILLTEPVTTLYAQWERDEHILSLYKIDSDGKKPLSDAIFGLYCYENNEFRLVDTLITESDGHIYFPSLQTDVLYRLVEETPPDGYAIITKEIFFKLMPIDGTVSFVFCDSTGNISGKPGGINGEYITGNKTLSLTVENLRGYELPSTGGHGTLLYILCGTILILGPFVYGFSLRCRNERRSKK